MTTTTNLPASSDELQVRLLAELASAESTDALPDLKAKLFGEAGLLKQFATSGANVDRVLEMSNLVYSRLRDLGTTWDEFHDREIVDWKRVRGGIEHENMLTNHRFTWLLTSQGFFITAFALVFQASASTNVSPDQRGFYRYILAGLAALGICAAAYLIVGLQAAQTQHDLLRDWWHNAPQKPPKKGRKAEARRIPPAKTEQHPPICGYRLDSGADRFTYQRFPLVFIFAWIGWIAVVLAEPLKPYAATIGLGLLGVVGLLTVLILGILIGRHQREKGESESEQAS